MRKMKSLCITLLFISLMALITMSCSNTVTYKPSNLPSLIAFSSDRYKTVHIYTVKPDGNDLKSTSSDNLTFDGVPMWSPDGTRIAFCSNQSSNYEVWTMNEDGSDRRKLTDAQGWKGLARWSPDGSSIVFNGQPLVPTGSVSFEIFLMNPDGSDVIQLTDSWQWNLQVDPAERFRWNSVPTWSPDGSKILFASNRDGDGTRPILYTMNPDGSDQKKFGLFFEVDGTEPDWSPVSNKIVLTRGNAAKGDIWVMDAGSPFPLLTAKKLSDNIDNNHSPVWSPDGTQIAFVSDTYGNADVFIMNADGSNVRRITYDKANDYHPTWR